MPDLRLFRHLFLDRSYERYYSAEKWERAYREGNGESTNPREAEHFQAIIEILRGYDKGALLDLGCGSGVLWEKYREASSSPLVGIDYSETAVARASQRHISDCRFIHADSRIWQPDRQFAVIVFNESLYYSDDFMELLCRAKKWLTPDGVFVVSMFNRLVTKRIWKEIAREYRTVESITVAGNWTIRVLR